uniref:Uncharacterized protein n=1 Tax=Strombidinopsis acuminata TaxID=141414 RepID=A0A7S3SIN9_9SPIT|mmetsp:Transcript_9268/g.23880  ORF Transcript_9268/g.23880 Transcript_9268/m.23880 type:complete len:317 (+) Transcript_9268:90-1040(+)
MAHDVQPLSTQVQTFVHDSGCTLVMPSLMVGCSMVLLIYRHATEEKFDLPLGGFLANILLSMMPLVALKAKIWSCNDRVSLVPLALVKTLLMHLTLGIVRLSSQVMQGGDLGRQQFLFDIGVIVGALALLKYEFGFPMTVDSFLQHTDVRNMIVMAFIAATATEAFFVYGPSAYSADERLVDKEGLTPTKIFFTASNYVDIVAFMPVVRKLYEVENSLDDYSIGTVVSSEAQRQVRLFFLFVASFYAWDDVIDPVMHLLDEPLAMMAHAAHFMLLLDFAGFFLFQVGNTSSNSSYIDKGNRGEVMGLLEEGADQDD